MKLTFELGAGVKQTALSIVDGLIQSIEGLTRTRRLTLSRLRENFSHLTAIELKYQLFPAF